MPSTATTTDRSPARTNIPKRMAPPRHDRPSTLVGASDAALTPESIVLARPRDLAPPPSDYSTAYTTPSAAAYTATSAATALGSEPEPEPDGDLSGLDDDPELLCVNLTHCVIEILAGARALDQIGRWVTDSVFLHLLRRTVLAARARSAAAQEAMRPRFRLGTPVLAHPADGVIEAVVVVHQTSRSRAVALRLERHRSRWRATALSVL